MESKNKLAVFSTCGTSIFTNKIDQNIKNLINKYTNYTEFDFNEIPNEHKQTIEKLIENRKNEIINLKDSQEAKNFSAELNGIISLYKGNLKFGENDYHILLHTDTFLGKKAAEIVVEFLNKNGIKTVSYPIEKLKTDNMKSFREGVNNLIKLCNDMISILRDKQYKIIFNLTGSFKSVQGVMQTLGMVFADEIFYIFETSNEILRIPKLPVKLEFKDEIKKI